MHPGMWDPRVFCIDRGILIHCATWEVQYFKVSLSVVLAHRKLLGNALIISRLSFKLERTRTGFSQRPHN